MDARRQSGVGELVAAVPEGIVTRIVGDAATVVSSITHDSLAVVDGTLFACIVGAHHDGHTFAPGAVAAGASALLVERELRLPESPAVTQIVVTDTRAAVGYFASELYGRPSRQLRMIGITGTNGKTTTAHLVAAILRHAGMEVGVLGTLSGARTTPEAPDLQLRLAEFVDAGSDAVVMEVSSHALALDRVNGTHFDVAVFTNIGRDHLDLHGSIESYFRAKARLFRPDLADRGVVNVDDPYGRVLLDLAAIDLVPFSRADATDVIAKDFQRFTWRGQRVEVGLGGEFNVMNSLAALTAASALGVDAAVAARGLSQSTPVPGRFEIVGAELGLPFTVVVDYAHTPDGLTGLLAAARSLAESARVVAVFGCGGDRDREKRPQMGLAAAEAADVVVVTSDNPRSEPPDEIIRAVVDGIPAQYRDRVAIDPDRRAAIATALGTAQPGDVVVIAGKGHETTQTIGDSVLEFDDRVVARGLMEDLT